MELIKYENGQRRYETFDPVEQLRNGSAVCHDLCVPRGEWPGSRSAQTRRR